MRLCLSVFILSEQGKRLFQVPNGHLLNDEERDAIVDDAFAYGVKNWADTFDEAIESLPSRY